MYGFGLFVILLILCSVGINALENITITAESDLTSELNQFTSKSDAENIFFYSVIIESLAEDSFKECTNLKLIYLHMNGITEIPENLFKFNTEVRFFTIKDNLLTTLHPNTFAEVTKVRVISLLRNKLIGIDEQLFANNIELVALGLMDNQIGEIQPRTFENLVNLQTLFLSENRLSTLPDNVFAANSKLRVLNLSKNLFKVLSSPSHFGNNPALQELNLEENMLRSFDFKMLSTNNIVRLLSLRTNVLYELPHYEQSQQFLPKLNRIKLSHNSFNCSYYAKVHTHFVSAAIRVRPTFNSTTFDSLDELEQSQICISDDKYEEKLARRLKIDHQKLPETMESIDALKQKLYKRRTPSSNRKVLIENISNFLEDQKHCANGMEGYTLKIMLSCDFNLF